MSVDMTVAVQIIDTSTRTSRFVPIGVAQPRGEHPSRGYVLKLTNSPAIGELYCYAANPLHRT